MHIFALFGQFIRCLEFYILGGKRFKIRCLSQNPLWLASVTGQISRMYQNDELPINNGQRICFYLKQDVPYNSLADFQFRLVFRCPNARPNNVVDAMNETYEVDLLIF